MKHIQHLYDSIYLRKDLICVSSSPYVTDLFKYSSAKIHSVWSLNVRDLWPSSLFSCPGIWFARILILFPNTQFQVSLAISVHVADLVPSMWLTYETALVLSDIMQITLLHNSLQKHWKLNLISSNSSSLIWQFYSSMDHIPLIELAPFVPPQPVLLASVDMLISTSLEIRFLLQSFMLSIHHLIFALCASLIVIFASNFPLILQFLMFSCLCNVEDLSRQPQHYLQIELVIWL